MSEGWGDARQWLLWGCAAILLIPILAVVTVSVRTWIPLRVAGSARADLETRFGAPGAFAPAARGEIAPDRIEAFLSVRRSMMKLCPRFEELETNLRKLDQGMTETEPQSGKEIVGVFSTLLGALGDLTPLVADYFRIRNEALVDAEMGIGEYAYLFTIAYGRRLLADDVKQMLFADGASHSAETHAALLSVLALQRERLSTLDDAVEFRVALDGEITALEQDPARIPWQDRLPESLFDSVAPYRGELDVQFCPQTAGMATDLNSDRAMAIALD